MVLKMNRTFQSKIFKFTGIFFILFYSWTIFNTYQVDRQKAFFQGCFLTLISTGSISLWKLVNVRENQVKKLNLNFKDKLSVTFNQNLSLPEDLTELTKSLSKDRKAHGMGLVTIDEISYPAVFIPFLQSYQGSRKLYSRIIFSAHERPEVLSQTTIDRISEEVCQKIKVTLMPN